jgi:predicted glycosyltransferase
MNILACGTPALVWPFGQNREQRLRAGRLASLGVLQVLENEDLDPDRLAVIMDDWMSRSTRPAVKFDLNGAANTARWIENRIKFQPRRHEGTKKRI